MEKRTKIRIEIILIVVFMLAIGGIFLNAGKNMIEKPVYLYLVRHGQTETNTRGLYVAGDGNAPLTRQGIEDAAMLGFGLNEIDFTAAYCSDLDRTYSTAENILKWHGDGCSIERDKRLGDISVGEAEGCSAVAVNEKYGEIFGDASDSEFVSPVNGETRYEYCERMEDALADIAQEYIKDGGNILVVSHSSMGFWLQKQFPDKVTESGIDNCSVSIVKYEKGEWELLSINDISYLEKGKEIARNIKPLHISIIANAETIHEKNGMVEGRTDSKLTAKGRKTAEELGEKLSFTDVRAVFCSSLNRSEEMRECILPDWKEEIEEDILLDEINLGIMEGANAEEWKRDNISQMEQLYSQNQVNEIKMEDGETGMEAAYRLKSLVEQVEEEYEYCDGTVVIFTHPYILTAYLNEYFAEEIYEEYQGIRYVELIYDNDGIRLQ